MEEFDKYLKNKIDEILKQTREAPELFDEVYTDNIGEIIEKLIILNIRMWMLEDAAGTCKEEEYIIIKKKLDICFKQKRPKLIQAINKLLHLAIQQKISLKEESVKNYKGIK